MFSAGSNTFTGMRGCRMWQKKDIVNEFQRLGKRITKQRMVILDVILEQNWTDCKEVYYEAVQRDSTVGLSTVYRTIRMLEEMGVLKRVYQYVFTDESGEQRDGENEIIAPEFHGKGSQTDRKRRRKMLFRQRVIKEIIVKRNDCKFQKINFSK